MNIGKIFLFSFFRKSFNKPEQKSMFLEYFGLVSWTGLAPPDQKQHVLRDCQSCLHKRNTEIYQTLRKNRAIGGCDVDEVLSIIKLARTTSSSICAKKIVEKLNPPFLEKFGVAFDEALWKSQSDEQRKGSITATANSIGTVLSDNTNKAVLCHNVSYRTISNVREKIVLHDRTRDDAPKKRYVINHESFEFDRERFTAALCGYTSAPVFTHLAEQFPVRQSDGKLATNGPQVLKAYAISKGLVPPLPEKLRERKVNRKIDVEGVKVNIARLFPTAMKLKELTRNQIECGDLDIGTPVVPITLHVRRYEKETKTLVRSSVTLTGRSYSLQKIMDKSLKEQTHEGLLRQPYRADYSIQRAKQELQSKG